MNTKSTVNHIGSGGEVAFLSCVLYPVESYSQVITINPMKSIHSDGNISPRWGD